jgi:hypothetical protein
MSIRRLAAVPAVICASFLVACSGDGSGGGGGTGGSGNDEVQATLDKLDIETPDTNRVDADGNDLPDSYTPLGSKRALQKKSEIFLASLGRTSETDRVNLLKFLPGISGVPGQPDTEDRVVTLPSAPLDTSWNASNFNAAAGGDIDGDGFEEIVVVWVDPGTMALRVKVIDDESEGFAESSQSTLSTASPTWLALVTGDFNGDGTDQIAVAIADDAAASINLVFLEGNKTDGYTAASAAAKSWSGTEQGSELGIELATGQLDRDAGQELVVVVNETFGSGTNQAPGSGKSTYYVYDDEVAAFAELANERIVKLVGNDAYTGVVGTVALGDVDGDSIDEILIAALDRFAVRCEPVTTVQFLLDDLDAELADLSVGIGSVSINNCEQSGNNGHTEHLWADMLNIDGDQYAEVQINGTVYDDFVNAGPDSWEPMIFGPQSDPTTGQIPVTYLFRGSGNNRRLQTRRDNTVISVGDVTADGFDDILVYMPDFVTVGQQTNGNTTFDITEPAVSVWGVDPLTGEFGLKFVEILSTLRSQAETGSPPVVLAVNVDNDTTVLKFGTGSHRLVYSEPIVHAALAAPPCWDTGIQNSEECRTSWGTGSSAGVEGSVSHTITARYHTGVEGTASLPFIGDVGVEVERSVGVGLGFEASLGYETTRTITYTTGPMEDTVVATVIPYDQYTYEILSHPVYPELVGEEVVISLPRRPRTIQIERQFYNEAIVGGGVRIDSTVFTHTIGDPRSYPAASERNRSGARAIGPVDVGTNSGSTSVEISESLVAGFTTSVTVSYETSVKATSGKVMGGFSVGTETTASLGVTVGSTVTFQGTVGEIAPPNNTLENEYSYGMFVYKQSTGEQDRPFQVINYWVE